MIIQILALIIIFIIIYLLFLDLINILFRGYPPFISTNRKVLQKIVDELEITDEKNIYELGCGSAWFLEMAEKKNKNANFFGIEYSLFPYIFSKIRLKLIKSNIKIIRKNIFDVDLSKADIIYTYFMHGIMSKLGEKIKKECSSNTIIISHQFEIPNLKLIKTMSFKNRNFYFYKIS